jgi:putative membrane protein
MFMMFSSIGTWGYTYRAHRKFDGTRRKDATTIMNERYASGEITRDQYREMRLEISIV